MHFHNPSTLFSYSTGGTSYVPKFQICVNITNLYVSNLNPPKSCWFHLPPCYTEAKALIKSYIFHTNDPKENILIK